jgi:hypothetical protein
VDDGGRAFGAFIGICWPKLRIKGNDRWCRSFLFTIDGEGARRFPTVTPPTLYHTINELRVGELTVDVEKGEYSVDAESTCTGGQFPAISGKLKKWEVWRL